MGRLNIAIVRHEHVPMFLMLLNEHRGTSGNAKSEEARLTFLQLTLYQHARVRTYLMHLSNSLIKRLAWKPQRT